MFYDITTNTELEELDHGYASKYRVRFLYAFGHKVLVNPTIQNLVLCLYSKSPTTLDLSQKAKKLDH